MYIGMVLMLNDGVWSNWNVWWKVLGGGRRYAMDIQSGLYEL